MSGNPSAKGRQVYYALRRRETGRYIRPSDGYSDPTEQDQPALLRKLSKARDQRRLALWLEPRLGVIEIERVFVTYTTDGLLDENMTVTERLVRLCGHKTGWLVAAEIEGLLRDDQDRLTMRYAIMLPVEVHESKEQLEMIRTVARVSRKGAAMLVQTETDLAAIILVIGRTLRFIYDFEQDRVVFPLTYSDPPSPE